MSILNQLNMWQKRKRAAHQLNTLSDHSLADLGLRRSQIDDYVRHKIGE